MYPFLRFHLGNRRARRMAPLGLFDVHVSHHRCMPLDIDPWVELNNGRTLTLYDLGRMQLAVRAGMVPVLRNKGWGIAVAGVSVRYRRRIRVFERFTMTTRLLGWDARFLYLDQALWKGGECANQMLLRWAVTGPEGIVPTAKVAAAIGHDGSSPALPDWVQAWITAEATRPWPPDLPGFAPQQPA